MMNASFLGEGQPGARTYASADRASMLEPPFTEPKPTFQRMVMAGYAGSNVFETWILSSHKLSLHKLFVCTHRTFEQKKLSSKNVAFHQNENYSQNKIFIVSLVYTISCTFLNLKTDYVQ